MINKKLIDKVNKRIERLQKAGIRNNALFEIENALQALGVATPKNRVAAGKITAENESALNVVLERFGKLKAATVAGAKAADKAHYENFRKMLQRQGNPIAESVVKEAYARIGDIDYKQLLHDYTYPEIIAAIADITAIEGLVATTETVDKVLRESTMYNLIKDVLEENGALDPDKMRQYPYTLGDETKYIEYAERNGITAAVMLWNADLQRAEDEGGEDV